MFSGKSWTLAFCVLIYVNLASTGVTSESTGSSFTSSISTANSDCAASKAEVCIALDHSGSINAAEFDEETGFAVELVKLLKIDAGAIQVGLINYGSTPNVWYGHGVKKTVATFEANLPAGGGYAFATTDTAAAIDMCCRMSADAATNVRSGVPKFIVVVTDGKSDDPKLAIAAADDARSKGTTLMALGVDQADEQELKDIACPGLSWLIQNVPWTDVAEAIADHICD